MQTAETKERNLDIQIRCVNCGQTKTIFVAEEDWDEYYNSPNRRHIQDIFPYLSAGERELLLSRVCSDCWVSIFGEDED